MYKQYNLVPAKARDIQTGTLRDILADWSWSWSFSYWLRPRNREISAIYEPYRIGQSLLFTFSLLCVCVCVCVALFPITAVTSVILVPSIVIAQSLDVVHFISVDRPLLPASYSFLRDR